jgi:hypothetical protein
VESGHRPQLAKWHSWLSLSWARHVLFR